MCELQYLVVLHVSWYWDQQEFISPGPAGTTLSCRAPRVTLLIHALSPQQVSGVSGLYVPHHPAGTTLPHVFGEWHSDSPQGSAASAFHDA